LGHKKTPPPPKKKKKKKKKTLLKDVLKTPHIFFFEKISEFRPSQI
jgi:hypothetical protein